MQLTFSIIKPDATKRKLENDINKIITDSGLEIVAKKELKLTREQAENFYSIHKDKSFFKDLIEYMTSENVIVQVLKGNNSVERYRKVMGSTNPENAEEGTIRKKFALNIQENSVHGSDSEENAKNEIKFFFSENELFE